MTFLTAAKDFSGQSGELQKAALANWRHVCPEAEIVLLGGCKGAESVCQKQGVRQVFDVRATESGIPYFDAVVSWAREHARHDLLIYANADVLFPPDFGDYLAKMPVDPFLAVGQRIDLNKNAIFDPEHFYEQLREVLHTHQAEVHRPAGMDFFIFRRGMWQGLKPSVVGRGGYDSALVAYCLREGIPVIDASFAFPVVHQWHDYAHISGGQKQAHYGADARFNFETHQLRAFGPNCLDAGLMMLRSGEIIVNNRRSLWRMLEVELYYRRGLKRYPNFNPMWNILTRGGKYIKNPQW